MKERMDPMEFRNLLEKRTRVFATTIFKLLDALPKKNSTRVIIHQLGKSASSIGANYREDNRAELRNLLQSISKSVRRGRNQTIKQS